MISLAEAVAMATANNWDYQNRKDDLYRAALDLTTERHKYAIQWFGTINTKYLKDAGVENTDIETNAGFNVTQILGNGAMISTGLAIDWMRFINGDPRNTLGSVLTGSFLVPILGIGGGKAALENLTQIERMTLYQIRTFNRFRQTFVVSIVSDYYVVLQQRDKVINAENNYKRQVESTGRLEMEADAGRRPRYEVDQAKQQVLAARDSYVQEQQRYEQLLDQFKIRLTLPTNCSIELDQNELDALEAMGLTEPDYTLDAAIETALIWRLDLANSSDSIDDAVRKYMLAVDGLGVQLNVSGSANVNSKPSNAVGDLQLHQGNYQLDAHADLPLDRVFQRNAFRESLLDLEKSKRQYQIDEDTVILDVRQAYRQLQQAAEQYKIRKNSLALAQNRVSSMSLLIEAGRATTRDLLDAQDALLAAQDDVTSAIVQHTIAKLTFFKDIGVLTVRPDGMWVN
jgi:outer membrane protein TolC